MPKAIDINEVVGPRDALAVFISDLFVTYETYRNSWISEKKEIRDYIFATDTTKTSARSLPWKNSVHIPKLCQIRDNLSANYMGTLFPNDRAIRWEGDDENSEARSKRLAIESYISNKLRMSKFRNEVQKVVNDWIDYGNCFGRVEYVNEVTTDEFGDSVVTYTGPVFRRISPLDIVFNPAAQTFEQSPKIIRSLTTLAALAVDIETKPELAYMQEVFNNVVATRQRVTSSFSRGDSVKNDNYQIDGFGSWTDYLKSDTVEILEFHGDVFVDGKVKRNQQITVVDRMYVIDMRNHPSWLGHPPIFHCGWRLRPDNLYAMGPLDNLVGMQYRIDHLENAKADAYDLIVHPVMKIRGLVEDFDYGPGSRIYADDGDVTFMSPDTTMLSADTQIAIYEAKMEEMAGAPKQAMGLRSPGEKTAFEVQVLENGANRVFLNKTSYFEEMFIEPILNHMLEVARRNMNSSDVLRIIDDEYGAVAFMSVTREDISARGKIRPIGARSYARNATILQNLTNLASSALGQDAAVSSHISGKKLAMLMEELLGLERHALVRENVRVAETIETQMFAQSMQQVAGEQELAGEQLVEQ